MIGAGLRLLPENSVLFERVINAVIDVSTHALLFLQLLEGGAYAARGVGDQAGEASG
jgi:hypothetical protein